MIQEHLSDENIQEYILQGEINTHISLHISACEACKTKVKAYRVLIDAVNTLEPEMLPFNISELVMHKIETQSKKEKTQMQLFYISLLAAIVVPVCFILPLIATIFKNSQPIHGASLALLFTVTSGVILFLLIDMFRVQKEKELHFSL